MHAWADQLGKSYARDAEESRSTGVPMQEVMYRRLFTKEEILCEDCEENLDFLDSLSRTPGLVAGAASRGRGAIEGRSRRSRREKARVNL